MRYIFSEENKIRLWRKIWLALAEAQFEAGLLSHEELNDLKKHQNEIDIKKILQLEKEIKHDVMAAIHEYAQKAKVGGRKIHLGATSYDIVDNAHVLRIKEALILIEDKLKQLLLLLSEKITQYASFPCLGFTHLQPAEPTTIGYRLAFYAQNLLIGLKFLKFTQKILRSKGIKGAVGTSASFKLLLKNKKIDEKKMENLVMKKLNLKSVLIANQTCSQIFDYIILVNLNIIASSLAKFAGDLRILQSPPIGEWSEPFSDKQVGSSAMPFKKNPIASENICSLARYLAFLPNVALENATLSYLERTLDDSANRRIIIPEAFLVTDHILNTAIKIVKNLVINEKKVDFNLKQYGLFAATEMILIEAVKAGADRQKIHQVLKEISMIAWEKIAHGEFNPMRNLLLKDERITNFIAPEKIKKLLNINKYLGNASKQARRLIKEIKKNI